MIEIPIDSVTAGYLTMIREMSDKAKTEDTILWSCIFKKILPSVTVVVIGSKEKSQ